MKVRFITNLGSIDADKLGLDFHKCKVDDVLEVDNVVGDTLVKSGVAEVPTPEQLKAIAKEAAVTAPAKQL